MTFDKWLRQSTELSESSIYKYTHAIPTITNDMLRIKVIDKHLSEMELYEIDLAISVIFRTGYFLEKDKKGNHMYSSALKWYRCFVELNSKISTVVEQEEIRILSDTSMTITEKEAIVKSRVGQGRFREKLLNKYGRCIITGLDIPQTLIASHIKPWAVSTNDERIDENNGLILSATYDRLFDNGLISFTHKGKIMISKSINQKNTDILALSENNYYDLKISNRMKDYLEYHNEVIFLK